MIISSKTTEIVISTGEYWCNSVSLYLWQKSDNSQEIWIKNVT